MLVALLSAPATASAAEPKPIVPGAVPLSMQVVAGTPSCPSVSSLDGTTAERLTARELKRRRPDIDAVFGVLAIPTPIVLACDPDAGASRRWLGPLRGSSALTLSDGAWWGQRALYATASRASAAEVAGGVEALRVGDRVELPALGSRGRVTAAIATVGGASTLDIAGAPSAPTTLEVRGTAEAPTLLITRADGTTEARPVPVRAVVRSRVQVRATATGLQVTVRAAPWTIALSSTVQPRQSSPISSTGPKGRTTLELTVGRRGPGKRLSVLLASPSGRVTTVWRCQLKGLSARQRRCTRENAKAARAARAEAGPRSTRTAAAPQPAAVAPLATRAAKLATAPATTTRIARDTSADATALFPGDLNGDGRPDAWTQRRRPSGATSTALLISDAQGAPWARVKVNYPSGVMFEPLPDLTGDGRAELPTGGTAIATDALPAGGPLPAAVDLTRRTPRPTDLVGPSLDDGSLFASLITGRPIVGALPDETGDGRAELVVGEVDPIVLPSEAYPLGSPARLAWLSEVRELTQATFDRGGFNFGISTGDDTLDLATARRSVSSRVIAGELWTVAVADRSLPPTQAQPIVLRRLGAAGQVLAQRTFTAAGVPEVMDVDRVTGDALVRLRTARCNTNVRPVPRTSTCTSTIQRIAADGTVLLSITTGAEAAPSALGGFLPRAGAAAPDVVLWGDTGGITARPPFAARAPLEEGTIAVARADLRGAVAATSLPVLAEGGAPLQSVAGTSLVVLPNGSRWLAGDFMRAGDDDPDFASSYALVTLG